MRVDRIEIPLKAKGQRNLLTRMTVLIKAKLCNVMTNERSRISVRTNVVLNERTDILVTTIELLRLLNTSGTPYQVCNL